MSVNLLARTARVCNVEWTKYDSTDAMTNDSTISSIPAAQAERCPSCGGANNCALARSPEQNCSGQPCWCMVEPIGAPLPVAETASCYCQRCLHKLSLAKNAAQLHKPDIPRY